MLTGLIFDDEHNDYILERIHFHACMLARALGPGLNDVDDFEDLLAIDVFYALRRYDAERSALRTFASRVIRRRFLGLLREGQRPKNRFVSSLDASKGDDITEDHRHRMRGHRPVDDAERAEVAELVRDAIDALPKKRLKEIALLLMSHTQAEVAELLGVSDTTIDRARKKIRAHFEDHGLRDLLRKA